jgi:hypothetical protein
MNGVVEDWRKWLWSSVCNGTHSCREREREKKKGGRLGNKEIEEAKAIIRLSLIPRVAEDGHSLGEVQPQHFVCLEYI